MAKTTRKPQLTSAENYDHKEQQVLIRPDVGLQAQFKKKKPAKTYQYDSSLDPELSWDISADRERAESLIAKIAEAKNLEEAKAFARQLKQMSGAFLNWTGKKEHSDFTVPTLPLFIHERLSTKAILESVRKRQLQPSLFADPQLDIADRVLRAYEYKTGWVNRLILGDNLHVMNSLLEYEGLGGQVQMIYMDPPYGVKFGSNFQPFVRKRDVKHNDDEDMTREPEMVKAYRDTWELGLHSYLTYMRDRLYLAKDLLHSSGSIFVQISDENVHHVRELMDEVFGVENFAAIICVTKTAGGLESTTRIPVRIDYLVWYAKDIEHLQYRGLFEGRSSDIDAGFNNVELPSGEQRPLTTEERAGEVPLPTGSRLFRSDSLTKPGPGAKYTVEFNGKTYDSGGRWWGTPKESLEKLITVGRVRPFGNTLRYVKYLDDFPFKPFGNLWDGLAGAKDPVYVVQTNEEIVKRCMLMTTDPGDLVLDPFIGSGTTALAARILERHYLGIELNPEYCKIAESRLTGTPFLQTEAVS